MFFPSFPFGLYIGDAPVPKHGETSLYRHTKISRRLCGQSYHLLITGAFHTVHGSWYLSVLGSSGRYPRCSSGSRRACAHAENLWSPQSQFPASVFLDDKQYWGLQKSIFQLPWHYGFCPRRQ